MLKNIVSFLFLIFNNFFCFFGIYFLHSCIKSNQLLECNLKDYDINTKNNIKLFIDELSEV
jgi:hypothetical protein